MRAFAAIPFVTLGLAIASGCGSDATGPSHGQTGRVVNGVRTAGTTSMLVIPALFASSTASAVTQRDLQQRFFDGPSQGGTLAAYFREVSGDRFTLRGTVTPWVHTQVELVDVAL